uniref:DUF4220 domain-containing protein n=1 Tax=Oryza brachyantha TaxID=4533 RepID=J3LQP1_ORYBR
MFHAEALAAPTRVATTIHAILYSIFIFDMGDNLANSLCREEILMAAADPPLVRIWKEWAPQVLVLLSFTLQVVLLILAELRRSVNSGVLRAFVWSAYMLADTTAIYVLSHMSVASRSAKHTLVAFWAPFLLLHLGGQDNITAYAIEDNHLWLRHLQTLAVQYGERVWALRCAGSTQSSTNYRSIEKHQYRAHLPYTAVTTTTDVMDTEAFLLMAHELFDVPKDLLLEKISYEGLRTDLTREEAYKVAEMQLSLMHDVFYTKIQLMHTWYGFCIRIVSLLATAIALLLFHLSGALMDSYTTFDVALTYVLLIGAIVVEFTSVLLVKKLRRNNGYEWSPDHIINSQGQRRLYEDLDWTLEETILVWHLATGVYLHWYREEQQKATRRQQDDDEHHSSAEDLACSLRSLGDAFNSRSTTIAFATTTPVSGRRDSTMLLTGAQLGAKLINEDQSVGSIGHKLEMIVQEWARMLFYMGSRCSAYSHAKHLNNGGDLITVTALLQKYIAGEFGLETVVVLMSVHITNVSGCDIYARKRSISVNGRIVTRLWEEQSGRSKMSDDDVEYKVTHGEETPCEMESHWASQVACARVCVRQRNWVRKINMKSLQYSTTVPCST